MINSDTAKATAKDAGVTTSRRRGYVLLPGAVAEMVMAGEVKISSVLPY